MLRLWSLKLRPEGSNFIDYEGRVKLSTEHDQDDGRLTIFTLDFKVEVKEGDSN